MKYIFTREIVNWEIQEEIEGPDDHELVSFDVIERDRSELILACIWKPIKGANIGVQNVTGAGAIGIKL